jgi:hypothetical protein
MALFHYSTDKCSPELHEKLKRGVGLSIGRIQTEILDRVINKEYPELDDLKNIPPEYINE